MVIATYRSFLTFRTLLYGASLLFNDVKTESIMLANNSSTCKPASEFPSLRFPAEWEQHRQTFMVWPASKQIWTDLLPEVRKDIARIAKAVAEFEKVVLLVRPNQVKGAKKLIGNNANISMIDFNVDDLWARDTLPVFLKAGENSTVGVNFHFNGWGNKQKCDNDSQIAEKLLQRMKMPCIESNLIGEGGSLETDGDGTLLVTESSIVNDNRNEGKSRDEIETSLKKALGIKKVIWFTGVKDHDITDAHVDCLARFASPGVVVLNRPFKGNEDSDVWSKSSDEAKEILENSTDAKGNKIKVVELHEPDPEKMTSKYKNEESFLTSYVNYLVVNGGVIMPKFGDPDADKEAQNVLQQLYPDREVVAVELYAVASGGGGIHCATHDLPI